MRGKIWFPQGGCTIDGRKFDPRLVETRLDLGGKGFVSHPVSSKPESSAPAIEFAPRYCICMRFSNILFRLSVPWAQRLCLLRGREGGDLVALTSTLRPCRTVEWTELSRIFWKRRENFAWIYVYMFKYYSNGKQGGGFGLGNILFMETNYRIPWTVFVIRAINI